MIGILFSGGCWYQNSLGLDRLYNYSEHNEKCEDLYCLMCGVDCFYDRSVKFNSDEYFYQIDNDDTYTESDFDELVSEEDKDDTCSELDTDDTVYFSQDSSLDEEIDHYVTDIKKITARMKQKASTDEMASAEIEKSIQNLHFKEIIFTEDQIRELKKMITSSSNRGVLGYSMAKGILQIILHKRLYALAYNEYLTDMYMKLEELVDSNKYNELGKQIHEFLRSLETNLKLEIIKLNEKLKSVYNIQIINIEELLALSEADIAMFDDHKYISSRQYEYQSQHLEENMFYGNSDSISSNEHDYVSAWNYRMPPTAINFL